MQEDKSQQGQATPPAEGQPPVVTPPVTPPAEGTPPVEGSPAEAQIPYHKFQKKNEELKAISAELEKFKAAEKAKQEEELKKNQQFETLLQQKEAELLQLKTTVAEKEAESRKFIIKSAVMDKIHSADPINSEDILAFVDLTKFEIGEEGKIPGIEEAILKIKTEKPYLFKNSKPNPSENGKPNPGNSGTGNNQPLHNTPGGFVMDELAKLRQK